MADEQPAAAEPVTLGACNNPFCSKRCQQYEPGPKIGRDTWASCGNCTHTPETHRERQHTERRTRR